MLKTVESSLRWKPFCRDDLPLILSKQRELYSLNFQNIEFDQGFYHNITEWYTYGISRQGCGSYLLYFKDDLIGFYLFQCHQHTAYLMQMYVSSTYRKQGWGKKMLAHYEQIVQVQGAATSSFLHASSMNKTAVSFYENAGYTTLSEEKDDQGFIRYLMYKSLSKS